MGCWPTHRPRLYRQPVCRLLRALYGHPDSGGLWERHCDTHRNSVGFTEVTDWRSVYFHEDLVDDFKMAGPTKNLPKAWEIIRSKVKMESPEPFGLFLGCNHETGSQDVPGHGTVGTMSYNVEAHLKKSIEKYLGAWPPGSSLKYAVTLSVEILDGHDISNPSKPTRFSRGCPWCHGSFDESGFLRDDQKRKKPSTVQSGASADLAGRPAPCGVLAEKAARVLMQILSAALCAPFGFCCAVAKMAELIAMWDEECDKAIYHLMCYVRSTLRWVTWATLLRKWPSICMPARAPQVTRRRSPPVGCT